MCNWTEKKRKQNFVLFILVLKFWFLFFIMLNWTEFWIHLIGIVKAGHSDIVSIFPDSVLELHTTRSWDFLTAESGMRASPRYNKRISGSDVIIGMIDTGKFQLLLNHLI